MQDFETHPAGTAARIEQLENPPWHGPRVDELFLRTRIEQLEAALTRATQNNDMMFAKGMSYGQQVLKDTGRLVIVDSPELVELREALTRANAATAAAYEVAARAAHEEAWPEDGTYGPEEREIEDAERATVTVITAAIRALATPDQTAAMDRLIAEAVGPLINAADAMLAAFCVHENSAQIAAYAGMMNAILAASKKGGV